jgi:putative transposase
MKILKIQTKIQQPLTQEPVPVESIFEVYRRVFYAGFFQQLGQQLGIKRAKRIFNWAVVIYGMILQRLDDKGTLHVTVSRLIPCLKKFSDHKRVREKTVSVNPGAFSRARGNMPMSVVETSFDHLFETLHKEIEGVAEGPSVFLLDGSTLTLPSAPELVRAYPPAHNQHGVSHWPIMRVLVAHDLRTGMASRPVWGPACGPNTVSEQMLTAQLIPRLPAGAGIVADSNFGTFATAHLSTQTGHPVILRLTEVRALSIGGLGLNCGADQTVLWKPSPWDRKKHPDLTADALIEGRLIVRRIEQDGKIVKLYLITTFEDPADEIVSIYALRWNVETDLRSLKRTVRLQTLSSRTPDMVGKELVAGVAAYNLVITFMEAAARQAGLEPRELSFSWVQDLVYTSVPALMTATSPNEIKEGVQLLLRQIASCKLPKRRKRRSYPRKIWLRSRSFPTYPTKRRVEQNDQLQASMKK